MSDRHLVFKSVDVPFFGDEQVVLDDSFEYGAFLHVSEIDGQKVLDVRLIADHINPSDFRMDTEGARVLFSKERLQGEKDGETPYDRYSWYITPTETGHFCLVGRGDILKVSWFPYKGGFRVKDTNGIEIVIANNEVEVLGLEKLKEIEELRKSAIKELENGFDPSVFHRLDELAQLKSEVSKYID